MDGRWLLLQLLCFALLGVRAGRSGSVVVGNKITSQSHDGFLMRRALCGPAVSPPVVSPGLRRSLRNITRKELPRFSMNAAAVRLQDYTCRLTNVPGA